MSNVINLKIINEIFYILFCTDYNKYSIYFTCREYLILIRHILNAQRPHVASDYHSGQLAQRFPWN